MSWCRPWVEVALNGPWDPALQPRAPVAVEAIVAEALAAAEAGAAREEGDAALELGGVDSPMLNHGKQPARPFLLHRGAAMPVTLIPFLGALVGLVLISSGAARLQRLAEEHLAAEPRTLPRTYAQGVRAFARAVNGGRGLELSRATKAFARATGQAETYRRACRRMLVGLLMFLTCAVLASALHGT